jgi:hypothetical protein
MVGVTKTLAKEWGRYDVTVNCVAFGYIQTRLTQPLAEGEAGTIEVEGRKVRVGVQGARIAAMSQMIPLGRGGTPAEAAGAIYLFCSPDSDRERPVPGGQRRPLTSVGTLEIGVVGCGVAGQAAATFLAGAGHRVTVFERFTEALPSGAGLLLQPTGLAVLRPWACRGGRLGARVDGLLGLNHRGYVVLDLAYADLHPAAYGLGIHRGTLFGLLHDELQQSTAGLVTDAEIVDVVRDGARATVVGKAGAGDPFDLVVVADGALRLRERPCLRRGHHCPWGCIWATVPDHRSFATAPGCCSSASVNDHDGTASHRAESGDSFGACRPPSWSPAGRSISKPGGPRRWRCGRNGADRACRQYR